ncbi:hypothetical protein ET475_06970 [Microbacterium protaetiae]|uniref:Lipoprotein n=1 Tax=Microbacterium protaetiae TaxID=2509458 RepID=A0A4P6EDG4_9MICO|nr:hypothetical protein [Microbacterium protaetiae]QAY59756.1 hypothetical protein ET475_06970 [Microbacterium protaetiae]
MGRGLTGPAASAVLALGLLTGCSGAPFGTAGQCVDWVAFDTPADALEDASSAVVGTVGEKVGEANLFGYTVNAWSVQVDHWAKGSGEGSIRVLSAPETCSAGSPYPGGDPFGAASGLQLILLHEENGAPRTITPWQGIVPAPGGVVPEAWPPGTMGSPPATPGE